MCKTLQVLKEPPWVLFSKKKYFDREAQLKISCGLVQLVMPRCPVKVLIMLLSADPKLFPGFVHTGAPTGALVYETACIKLCTTK